MKTVTDSEWVGEGDKAAAKLLEISKCSGVPISYMTAGHLALARMQGGSKSTFSTRGLIVPNDNFYGAGKDPDFIIVDERSSVIFSDFTAAAEAYRRSPQIDASEEYDRLRQLASSHASDALKTGVLLVSRSFNRHIHTSTFGQRDVTVFIFGGEKIAADYGSWLKEEK